jgi:YHS domain-containing protein
MENATASRWSVRSESMRGMRIVSGIVAVAMTADSRAAGPDPVQWRTNFTQAAIEAQKQNKPLFISVHTAECAPCRKMHQTTLQDPTIVDVLNARCIPLRLDGDVERKLMNDWRVSAFPTHIIVGTSSSVRGVVLDRIEGLVGARELMGSLQKAVQKQATAAATMKDSEPGPSAVKASARKLEPRGTKAGPLKAPSPTEAEDVVKPAAFKTSDDLSPPMSAPLALGGHCPVCMIDRAEMMPGKKSETAVHDGRKYQFASAENKRRFLESPAKFLPGAGGDCVVTLAENGKRVPGDVKFPAMFADKVYFFGDKASRDRFLKDPESYVDARGLPKKAMKSK